MNNNNKGFLASPVLRLASCVAITAGISASLTGCKTLGAEPMPCAASSSASSTSEYAQVSSCSLTGTLSLKGSDFNSYWALTDAQGQVWRIATATKEERGSLDAFHHKQVTITGKPMGKFLANEQLKFESVKLVTEASKAAK